MRASIATGLWVFLLSLILAGCDCGGDGAFHMLRPSLEVDARNLEFGDVPVGAVRHLTLTVRNRGDGELLLEQNPLAWPFKAELLPAQLAAGQSTQLDLAFRPTTSTSSSASFELSSNDQQQPSMAIALSGRGVPGFAHAMPAQIDLRETKLDASVGARLMFVNDGQAPLNGQLLLDGFRRPEHFAMNGSTEPSPLSLVARQIQLETLDYHPVAEGDDSGRVIFELCGPRCGLEVEVLASASSGVLHFEPSQLDFGQVAIGSSKTLTVVAQNLGARAINLRGLSVVGEGLALDADQASSVNLAAQQSVALSISFSPRSGATVEGQLVINTDQGGWAVARVPIAAVGVGPMMAVEPAEIDFGVETHSGVVQRPFLVLNDGSVEVTVSELRIEGDPALSLIQLPGLPAILGPGESLTAQVAFTPAQVGTYSATITISSAASQVATLLLPIKAGFGNLRCKLELRPVRLAFGALPPGASRTLPASVVNVGQEACTVSDGGFSVTTHAGYSVEPFSGPSRLAPGDSLERRFTLQTASSEAAAGQYIFKTDDPLSPTIKLPLFGTGAPPCNGSGVDCGCEPGQTKRYSRYQPATSSGVYTPDQNTVFRYSCEASACAADQVQVQLGPSSFSCMAPPSECAAPKMLDVDGSGQWTCEDCPLLIQFGSLYDGLRACAPHPPMNACGSGQSPTFGAESRSWSCAPTCNNGQYDRIQTADGLVCVPC